MGSKPLAIPDDRPRFRLKAGPWLIVAIAVVSATTPVSPAPAQAQAPANSALSGSSSTSSPSVSASPPATGSPAVDKDRLFDDSPQTTSDSASQSSASSSTVPGKNVLKSEIEESATLDGQSSSTGKFKAAVGHVPFKALINATPLPMFYGLLPGQTMPQDLHNYEMQLGTDFPTVTEQATVNNQNIVVTGRIALCAPSTLDQARSWPALAREVSGPRRATWQYWESNLCRKIIELRGSNPANGGVSLHVAVKHAQSGNDIAVVNLRGEGSSEQWTPLADALQKDIDRLSNQGALNMPHGTLANEVHIILSVSQSDMGGRGR
jgi:hypothetical protein